LPETGVKGAEEVAARICECVSKDAETPHISISAGIAVYPQNGQTIESLLSASDQVLYKMKQHAPEALNVKAAKSN
jgi:GGDEF domain-containing protein